MMVLSFQGNWQFRINIVLILSVCLVNSTRAQWQQLGDGVSGNVRVLYTDTVEDVLYAGGDFTFANDTQVNHIAKWDGSNWSRVGIGVSAYVTAIIHYQGKLYVAGVFDTVFDDDTLNVNRFAKWDGSNWSAVLGGGPKYSDGSNGGINGFLIKSNELYVYGAFDSIGGILSSKIAKFDGVNWSSFPVLDSSNGGFAIGAASFYKGELYVGGNFNAGSNMSDIARYDGVSWKPVGNGLSGGLTSVGTLFIWQDTLIVAGLFYEASGDPGNNIAAWDGSGWSNMNEGLLPSGVRDVICYDNHLYACGQISNLPDSSPINRLAKWNGIEWLNAAPLIMLNDSQTGTPSAMSIYDGELVLGGRYLTINGDTMNNIGSLFSSTGIQELTGNVRVTIYPNPTSDIVAINLDMTGVEQVKVSTFDLIGRLIAYKQFDHLQKKSSVEIDIKNYAEGIYLISVIINDELIVNKKLVVIKK